MVSSTSVLPLLTLPVPSDPSRKLKLQYLASPTFSPPVLKKSEEDLFLLASVLDMQVFQFYAPQLFILSGQPFSLDGSQVSLTLSHIFLAKNEREGFHLNPIVIPSSIEGGQSHPPNPVSALSHYLDITMQPWNCLFE